MNTRTKALLIIGLITMARKYILELKDDSLIGTPSQWAPVVTSQEHLGAILTKTDQTRSKL